MFCGWRITLWYNTPLPYLGRSNSHICWCYSTQGCQRRDRIKRTTTLTTVSDCRLATNKLSAVSRTKLGISLLAHADLGVGARGPCPPNEFRERREIPSGAFRVQENLSAAGALLRTPLGESSAPAGSVDRRRAAFLNPTPVSQLTGGIIRHQSWLPSCHRYRKSSISCGQNNAVFAKFFDKS